MTNLAHKSVRLPTEIDSQPPGGTRLRLAYIVPGREFAGVERVVDSVAGELSREYGDLLDVHVLYFSHFAELKNRNLGYMVHYVSDARMREALPALRRFFRTVEPDIVIVAQCEMTALSYVASGFNKARALFIPHLHGNPQSERVSSLRSRLIFAFYDRFVAPAMSAVFAVSKEQSDFARRKLAANRPVYFVPNPLRNFPDSAAHEAQNGPPRFINVGRLCEQKGQDVLLRAFRQVKTSLPDAKLDLVGAGPNESMLRKLAADLSIADSVTFHGYQADPSPYLKLATCFVFPSRWEGFGLALVEALSYGLPAVVTDCYFGPRELITDERIGCVAPVNDADGLAAAMIAAASAESSADAVAVRKEIAARFALPAVGRSHFDAIRNVAENSGQQRFAEAFNLWRERKDVSR